MTTPESLEVMLLSSKVPHTKLFDDLRAVIVDEIHALAIQRSRYSFNLCI